MFYKYVNSCISYRSTIGALVDENDTIVTSDSDKANMFNVYYASVGVADDGIVPPCPNVAVKSTNENIRFDEVSVLAAIHKVKPNLSAGPDGLPPLLFNQLRYNLAQLYNQLFSVSTVPPTWKQAIITPVFKKGTAGAVCNYRPISLTCVASKIMEHAIANQIYVHLPENNLLSSAQHGFVKGRSTCTNLFDAVNDWTLTVQNNKAVIIAYLDFSRTFDSVT